LLRQSETGETGWSESYLDEDVRSELKRLATQPGSADEHQEAGLPSSSWPGGLPVGPDRLQALGDVSRDVEGALQSYREG
jgi:hypothetical protein